MIEFNDLVGGLVGSAPLQQFSEGSPKVVDDFVLGVFAGFGEG